MRIVRRKPRRGCPTGKLWYGSQAEAKADAHFIRQKHTDRNLRAYRCDKCNGWHLTHQPERNHMEPQYVIARSTNAGVFAGTLHAPVTTLPKEGEPVVSLAALVLTGARRIWYWAGAMSLSELAQHGTSKPESCKFGVPATVQLEGVCEVQAVTEAARKSIEEVPEWKK